MCISKGDNAVKVNQASLTAMVTAYMRAYHTMYDTFKIFDDLLAYKLIPDDKRTIIEHSLTRIKQLNNPKCAESYLDQTTTLVSLIRETNVISRARYSEDTLEKAVRLGIKQYVILGAGMDTFAFRQPKMMEWLEVFEVDHPATQELKLLRLAELGWEHPAKLHFIPIDFTKENLATALTHSSSYDPRAKSFFSWLGVTYYLTQEDVFATLKSIADVAPTGSIVVFDYFDTNAFFSDKMSRQLEQKIDVFRKIGEPINTGFNPLMLAEDIASLGFHLNENLSPADIEERYFKGLTYKHHAHGYWRIACAVVY